MPRKTMKMPEVTKIISVEREKSKNPKGVPRVGCDKRFRITCRVDDPKTRDTELFKFEINSNYCANAIVAAINTCVELTGCKQEDVKGMHVLAHHMRYGDWYKAH